MLPYLSAYMGHADLRGTQYYLRLTADAYPEVAAMAQARFGYVIPAPRHPFRTRFMTAPAAADAATRTSPAGTSRSSSPTTWPGNAQRHRGPSAPTGTR